MANSTTEKTKAAEQTPLTVMRVLAPALGWLIPGAGHMIQKRWIRGAAAVHLDRVLVSAGTRDAGAHL